MKGVSKNLHWQGAAMATEALHRGFGGRFGLWRRLGNAEA